jgi:Carboxypeptidase regulatory-like domain
MRRISLLAAVIVLLTTLSWTQTSTTSLRGTVTDTSGAIVSAAKVTLSNPARAIERTTTSGPAGEYEFLQVPPGTYQLSVSKAGFRTSEQKNLQLLVSTPTTVNVSLTVGAVSETIEVTAEGALVNTTDASLGNAFNERQVKELPLEGRNVPDLLAGRCHVHGQSHGCGPRCGYAQWFGKRCP